MRKTYIAEVRIDKSIKLVTMFLRSTNHKLVEKRLHEQFSYAEQVELKALVPSEAPVRPQLREISFA